MSPMGSFGGDTLWHISDSIRFTKKYRRNNPRTLARAMLARDISLKCAQSNVGKLDGRHVHRNRHIILCTMYVVTIPLYSSLSISGGLYVREDICLKGDEASICFETGFEENSELMAVPLYLLLSAYDIYTLNRRCTRDGTANRDANRRCCSTFSSFS